MKTVVRKASLPYRSITLTGALMDYSRFIKSNISSFLAKGPQAEQDNRISALLTGYPRNHTYQVHRKTLIPSFKLYERVRKVVRAWPEPLESFLDIASCKGYYVLEAAKRPTCQRAVGIDIDKAFVEASTQVCNYLGLTNTQFYLSTLDDVVAYPDKFGAPFQTVGLTGAYHYLFWGSSRSDYALRDHNKILERLAQVCSGRVILSARLELNRLPNGIKEYAMDAPEAKSYNTESFLACAESFFTVKRVGFIGTYPLFVMNKKVL